MANGFSAAKRLYKHPFVSVILFVLMSYLIGNLCAYAIVIASHVLGFKFSIFKTDIIADFLAGEACLLIGVTIASYVVFRLLREQIFSIWKGPVGAVILGIFVGLAIGLILNTLQVRLLEHLHYYTTDKETAFPSNRVLLLSLLVAFTEEMLYRGYIFQVLEKRLGTGVALTVSSLVFAGAHLFNPGWASTFSAACNTIFVVASGGLLFASCLILTQRIWMSISLHFSWLSFHTLLYGDTLWGVTSWFNATFDPQKVDQSSAILFCITSLIMLVIAVRRGNWKSIRHWRLCDDSKIAVPKTASVHITSTGTADSSEKDESI